VVCLYNVGNDGTVEGGGFVTRDLKIIKDVTSVKTSRRDESGKQLKIARGGGRRGSDEQRLLPRLRKSPTRGFLAEVLKTYNS